jgi:general L-amino acid transport system permease protein
MAKEPRTTDKPSEHGSAGEGVAFVRKDMIGDMEAPVSTHGIGHWMRENLFSSWGNTLLTLFGVYLIYVIVPPLVEFVFINGVFSGSDRSVCTTEVQGGIRDPGWFGGCWAYVGAYFNQFIYGFYPDDQQWRVNIVAILFFGSLVPLLIPTAPFKRENMIFTGIVFPVAAFILLTGGGVELDGFLIPDSWMAPSYAKFWLEYVVLVAIAVGIVVLMARGSDSDPMPGIKIVLFIAAGLAVVLMLFSINFGLEPVETEKWGGLLVTMVIAVTGIAASLPLGIALALGRRADNMPIIKMLSVIFIEFWRGVPLITVLFMSSVMLPLFLPEGVNFDKLLRALIGVALFSAAYMAEVVRGGLQAIPNGQYEGAQALGLNYNQMIRMIILPQALKLVIPGIVNTFIGLFKDTTLVLIIGLFDFLGQIQSSFADSTWASPVQSLTAYAFAAFVYWCFCFSMSRYSQFMERLLDTGHKR